MKSVILIGDSIRLGYEEFVRTRLAGTAEVWGPVENGETSENVLAHLNEWVISRRPDVVHVNCGLHDIKREFGQELPTVPLEEYRENVEAILNRILTETNAVPIWALITPVNELWHNKSKPFARFASDVKAYNAAAAQVAGELDVAVNNLYERVTQLGRDSLLQSDGVHFTPSGYELLGESVARMISAH